MPVEKGSDCLSDTYDFAASDMRTPWSLQYFNFDRNDKLREMCTVSRPGIENDMTLEGHFGALLRPAPHLV
jgi:hypothetical protein